MLHALGIIIAIVIIMAFSGSPEKKDNDCCSKDKGPIDWES